MEKFVRSSKRLISKHWPEILTGLSVLGTVGTAVLTGQATIKAVRQVDAASSVLTKEEIEPEVFVEVEKHIKMNSTDVIKETWTFYIPVVVVGATTIACIIGSNRVSAKRQASLASAYAMLSTAFADYQRKATELYGEDADEKIKQAVAQERYEKQASTEKKPGTVLFCEPISNWFWDYTMLEYTEALLEINKKMAENGELALNDLFEILGIPTHDYGEEIGWEWSAVCNMRGTSWMEFELELRTLNDGTEYYIINPKVAPYAFNYPYIPPTIVSDGENDAYFVKLNREEES